MSAAKTHNIEDIYPLSSLQEGILFHSLYSPEEGLYVDHMVCDLHASDQVNADALRTAFQQVVDRHQALRTAFVWKLNNKPQQVVLRKVNIPLSEHDWSDLSDQEREHRLAEFLDQARVLGFDPSKPPLLRLDLFRYKPDFAMLVFTYHHIIMDAWSVPIVFAEMQSFYQGLVHNAAPQLNKPRPFRDYINWLQQRDLSPAENFWRRELQGITAPTALLSERAGKNDAQSGRLYANVRAELPPETGNALRLLAQRHALILNTVVQGAWALLLGRCANTDDVLFGTVVSGRSYELQGVESMVGLFTNTLPIRVRLAPQAKLLDWLQVLQKRQFELHEYEWSPLAKLQEWSEFDRNTPLFESVVIFQNIPVKAIANGHRAPALDIAVSHHDPKNNFPLTLMVAPGATMSLRLLYDSSRFGTDAIQRNLQRFTALLGRIPEMLDQPLQALSILTNAERRELLTGWNAVQFPAAGCVHECFERRVSETPYAIAAACAGRQLTYADLNSRANSLARTLQGRCAVESIVVIIAERNLNFLIAMLAVFKAGCAYLPIDPSHPSSRIVQILGLSGSSLVLAGKESVETLRAACEQPDSEVRAEVLDLDDLASHPGDVANISRACNLQNLAYVIYTSGSTGVPKGAMIEHGGMINHLYAKITDLRLSNADVVAQTASQCFDISVWQFLAPLLVGGRVEIVPDEVAHNPALLLRETAGRGISVLEIVPSMLRVLLDEIGGSEKTAERSMARLSYMVVTGEELPPDLVRSWFQEYPDVPLVNAYGPTECSDDITHHFIYEAPEDSERIPIGRSLANMRLYVLDSSLELQPIGVMGELFAGGAGVGRGYLNDPARTADSFVPDPFSAEGGRLYRTGDLACRLPDGSFHFFGRIDSQLKIRGFRIELGEIESVLCDHPAVRQAVVLARKTNEAQSPLRLSAYVVPDPEYRTGQETSERYQHERTDQWKTVFDEVYGQKNTSQHDGSLHLRVWINTYTAQPFPEEEIFECVEDSVARIKSLQAKRVLEMGCGTGLLLFRLAPGCEQYWAADISPQALQAIEKRRHEVGGCDLRLFERPAHDFSGFGQEQFDLIILNEIVQYFPDGEYLMQVLAQAIAAVRPGGSVFVGGVRNLHLLNAFHTAVELSRAEDDLSIEELQARIRVRSDKEKELLVAPEFFTALPERFPALRGVRLVPKGGKYQNEFTRFRYDAILRIQPGIARESSHATVRWNETGGTLASFKTWLSQNLPEQVVVTGIPNARTIAEARACSLLSSGLPSPTVRHLRQSLAGAVEEQVSADPQEIKDIAEELGFCAEASWGVTDVEGTFNLLLGAAQNHISDLAFSFWGSTDGRNAIRQYTNLLQRSASSTEVIAELRRHVQQLLPDYMAPADYVVLPAFPLTSNGKVDRQALSRIDIVPAAREISSTVPSSPTEELVMTIWSGLLGTRMSRNDNFLESGGHSLLATQVISRVKKAFQIDLPLRTLFDAPTVVEFARVIDTAVKASKGLTVPPIVPAPIEGRGSLSYAQQRLWIMDQMEPGTPAYNLPYAVLIEGPLQIEALKAAVNETIRRHESLRTIFCGVGDEPRQIVYDYARMEPPVTDLGGLGQDTKDAEIRRLAFQEGRKPFDLRTGPLLRVHFVRTGENAYIVLFTMHHIVSDAWSAGILISELAALYRIYSSGTPSTLPPLAVQYGDFAWWQRQCMQGEVLNSHLTYWKQQLAGAPALKLPVDFPRTQPASNEGSSHTFQLSTSASKQLLDLARKESATLFMTTLAAFNTLLYRITGQRDIVVGTDIANRNHAETERLIGFFVNLLVLRNQLSGGLSFRKLIHRVREISVEGFAHQDLPFDVLTRELRLERALDNRPLFDVLFVFQNAPMQSMAIPGVKISPLPLDYNTARFDIALFLEEGSQGLAGKWIYRTSLFRPATVFRLSRQFEALLEDVAARPDALLDEFSLSTPECLPQEGHSPARNLEKLKGVRPKGVSLSF